MSIDDRSIVSLISQDSHAPLPRKRWRSGLFVIGVLFSSLGFGSAGPMVPSNLPWTGSTIANRAVMIQPGIAALTCGTVLAIDPPMRYSFGLIDLEGAVPIPAIGRDDVTLSTSIYHHPSWLVSDIGNVFGVAINENTGDIFLSASSNYGAGFFSSTSVLNYGSIGGGPDALTAAGTVYAIDAVTGQASVFAVLPQQLVSFTHRNCEGSDTADRTTGVGLGNIHYDSYHDQYFVTNIEDGRIYRLGPTGVILDSYDPGIYDDGVPGITSLTDLVYGVAVEPGGRRLFFGGVSTTNQVPLRSIDLTATGGFAGIVDNSIIPVGASWNNFVAGNGNEVLHTHVSTEFGGSVYHLSDIEFTPASEVLVGIRVGCDNSWFTSHNHAGESNRISKNSSGLYAAAVTEFDVSVQGFMAQEDAYGGVSYYERADQSVDFVVSSSDILTEQGPHGIAIFRSVDAAAGPITPLGAVSYGINGDPKGVGGSVDVYSNLLRDIPAVTKEVVNGTSQLVNGFDWLVEGVYPPYRVVGPPFSTGAGAFTAKVIPDTTNTLFRWTGNTIQPGTSKRFGFAVTGQAPRTIKAAWTFDGDVVDCVPQITVDVSGIVFLDLVVFRNLINSPPECPGLVLHFDGFSVEWLESSVPFEDLADGIDRFPIRTDTVLGTYWLPTGAEMDLEMPFPPPTNAQFAVLRFAVADNPALLDASIDYVQVALPPPPFFDTDGDGVEDAIDNCTLVANPDQRDTNNDGFGNICDPDLNNDGLVNFADISLWVPFFNTATAGDEDFNGDGVANFGDYVILTSFFLDPPGPSGVAP